MNSTRIFFQKAIVIACMMWAFTGAPVFGQQVQVNTIAGPQFIPDTQTVTPRSIASGLPLQSFFNENNRVITGALNVDSLILDDEQSGTSGPITTGLIQPFPPMSDAAGIWTELADGGHLWTIAFKATGAVGIRLEISRFNSPRGAEMILFDPADPEYVGGPFTYRHAIMTDTFWTPTMFLEEVYLEYYLPPEINYQLPEYHIEIDALLNMFRDFTDPALKEFDCHLDVTCYPEWALEANAVLRLHYHNSDNKGRACSGSMYNRVPEDFTPLLATALHCEVAFPTTLEAYWFFQADSCDGSAPSKKTKPRSVGIMNLAIDEAADYRLVALDWYFPSGAAFIGWNNGDYANGSSATGIHHPKGTYKRISFGTKTSSIISCWFHACYRIEWPADSGVTQKGSSGSPILDANHRTRGVLSCGPTPSCGETNHDFYGRLATAYDVLEPWLDPVDPVYVDGAFTGTEQGTVTNPFDDYIKGIYAVIAGSDLYIEGGSYPSPMIIKKAMKIHGRNGKVTLGGE